MRALVRFALPFALAAALGCYAAPVKWMGWLGLLCALAALPCLLLRGDRRTKCLLTALGAAAGFLWFRGWTQVFVAPAARLAGTAQTVTGTVLDYPAETDTGVWTEVRVERGLIDPVVRLYAGAGCAGLEPGDEVTFTAEFAPSDLLSGERSTYFTARGVFALAYAAEGSVTWEKADRAPLALLPRVWAHALLRSMDRVFSRDIAALTGAVALGDKSGLDGGDVTAFNRSGLAHLLVVSGLHVSMLLQALTRLIGRGRRWLYAALTLPLLFLFVLMVGATPSAVRAAVMSSLLVLGPLLGRDTDPPTALCAALLLLLLQNPWALASVSLQLSFASVAGILLCSDPLLDRLMRRAVPRRARSCRPAAGAFRLVWGSVSVTLGAMAFTTPLIAFWFGTVPLIAPLSNLLVLWAGKYVFLGGLLCGLLGLAWPGLAALPAWIVEGLGRYVLWTARTLAALPFAAVALETAYYALWLAASCAIALSAFLLRRERGRVIVPLCCPAVLLCAALLLSRRTYAAAGLTLTVLDVGQGACAALTSGGRAALVDCGGGGGEDAGTAAADYFLSMGTVRLDVLVFTHLDDDHFNGAEELFARMDIGMVVAPGGEDGSGRRGELAALAEAEGAELILLDETADVALGESVLTLYPPLGGGTTNESGLFVLASAAGFDALITGDADAAVEAMLVKYYDIPDVDVLVCGHHGSDRSTSADFLAAVRPEYAVISCGYNAYGHPGEETLARLAAAGAAVYRTDLQGNVTVRAAGGVRTEE